jgi:hypothetical protein
VIGGGETKLAAILYVVGLLAILFAAIPVILFAVLPVGRDIASAVRLLAEVLAGRRETDAKIDAIHAVVCKPSDPPGAP